VVEHRKEKGSRARVKIELDYPDLETFVEKFASNVTRGGVFLQTLEPKPKGAVVRLELLLASGEAALRGEGKVTWVKEPDPDAPDKPCGMGISFVRVDRKTSEVLARIEEYKKTQTSSPPSGSDFEAGESSEVDDDDDDARTDQTFDTGSGGDGGPDLDGPDAIEPVPTQVTAVAEPGAPAPRRPEPSFVGDGAMAAVVASAPADWPEWMALWPIDAQAALGRQVAAWPVSIDHVDRELAGLTPAGFELSAALQRFVGATAAALVEAPRSATPLPAPFEASPSLDDSGGLEEGEGIDPVATVLAAGVPAAFDLAPEHSGSIGDLQLGLEPLPTTTGELRHEDDLANLYDLAREEGGADAMLGPDELPDLIDELMEIGEPALPVEHVGPDAPAELELDATAEPPPASPVVFEPRPRPTGPVPLPEDDILMQEDAADETSEFDDYDLIEEDIDVESEVPAGHLAGTEYPTYVPGSDAGRRPSSAFTEADSALNEIFGLSRPSDVPPAQGLDGSDDLLARHAAFTDAAPHGSGNETFDDATVVQQSSFSMDRVEHGGAAVVQQSMPSPDQTLRMGSPAIQPEFAPPAEQEDWFVAGSQRRASEPGSAPDAQPQAAQGRASQAPAGDQDGQARKRKSSFFRKLFGGGDDQR
jgi:uncharacterized protein (TIGR02266 family)